LAKYYLPVKDHFEYWFVYVNLDLWKKLSNEDQTVVQNAVSEMESRRWEVAEAEEQASIKRLSAQGTKIITLSEPEFAKTMEKVRQNVWPALKKEIGDEAFDEVVSSVKN
jgi:TRAP-type C4-dicarboxylate transport system substrate-binding protein